MSYFDDYVADGLCCEQCGEFMGGDEPGYVRVCAGCASTAKPKTSRKGKSKRGRK
jgi:hypothetical protein